MEKILQKIKKLQKENKLSTKEISKEIGVTSQTLYDYFSGKTQISIKNLQKIAKVFDVPMTYFFEEQTDTDNINYVNLKEENEKLNIEIKVSANELKATEKMNYFYWNFIETLLNNIADLFLKIVKNTPEMHDFLIEQDETRRIINRINTVEVISESKLIINRDFFEYFIKPQI